MFHVQMILIWVYLKLLCLVKKSQGIIFFDGVPFFKSLVFFVEYLNAPLCLFSIYTFYFHYVVIEHDKMYIFVH